MSQVADVTSDVILFSVCLWWLHVTKNLRSEQLHVNVENRKQAVKRPNIDEAIMTTNLRGFLLNQRHPTTNWLSNENLHLDNTLN